MRKVNEITLKLGKSLDYFDAIQEMAYKTLNAKLLK